MDAERERQASPEDEPREQGDDAREEREERDAREEREERSLLETSGADDELLQELVGYLRENRTELREEWARRISDANLLQVMSDEEIFSEATEVYDNYVDALETGSIETLQTLSLIHI